MTGDLLWAATARRLLDKSKGLTALALSAAR